MAKVTPSTGQLGIIEFGKLLLETEDLDPVYVVLWKAQLPRRQLARWLFAYWYFYHVGVASFLSEAKDFYYTFEQVIPGTKYPRGTERRHFRGGLAQNTFESLRGLRLTPECIVGWLAGRPASRDALDAKLGALKHKPKNTVQTGVQTAESVMQRAQALPGCGPWIAFKIADMLERLDLCELRFSIGDVFRMFKSPMKAAREVHTRYCNEQTGFVPEMWAYDYLYSSLAQKYQSPPRYDRPLNIQEIETILCKWHSHLHGKYEVGKDTKEIRHALEDFQKYKTARQLYSAGQEAGLW